MAAPPGSTENRVQSFIHALEQGNLAALVRGFVVTVVIVAVALVYLGWKFRGFVAPEAMDQAQVGSMIASGHGWSTRFLRPLALWQVDKNMGGVKKEDFPDTFNAPLPPLLDAVAVKLAGNNMEFKHNEFVAPAERFIVALYMLCFVGAVAVEYCLLRRVFDQRLAFWAALLTLTSDLCWRFTLSGLPQIIILLLFNTELYTLVRAIEAQMAVDRGGEIINTETGETAPYGRPEAVLGWLAATGALFGLLALTHGLTIWIFVGMLVFAGLYFRPRVPGVAVALLAFLVLYAPWMARNYHVCGSPFGVAGYTLFDGVGTSTNQRMRSISGPGTENIELYFFRNKVEDGIVSQVGYLVSNLGGNLVAAAFFLCLLHVFRRREVNSLRWAVLIMWAAAVVGMALIGNADPSQAVAANQIGVLFLPVMLGFGLAFVLVLYSRREGAVGQVARLVLFTVLFLVSAVPMIVTLLPRNSPPFQYPPYFEPGISKLKAWTGKDEVIGSDMPWAVAWYADRDSVWIPNKFADFMGMSDYAKLPGPLAGLFLTTFSRDEKFYSSIYKGDYQDWRPLIFGQSDLPSFPFKDGTLMLGDLSYTFYSDSKRWERPTATTEP